VSPVTYFKVLLYRTQGKELRCVVQGELQICELQGWDKRVKVASVGSGEDSKVKPL
jgi:hypothetical protein